jgi:GINS complex subunit 3
MALAAHKIE